MPSPEVPLSSEPTAMVAVDICLPEPSRGARQVTPSCRQHVRPTDHPGHQETCAWLPQADLLPQHWLQAICLPETSLPVPEFHPAPVLTHERFFGQYPHRTNRRLLGGVGGYVVGCENKKHALICVCVGMHTCVPLCVKARGQP